MWMQEMQNTENSCVLFYKSKGKASSYSFLNVDDFALIIMTEA